ncbi:hypothetical protein ACFV23_36380, partial [Streptomyces sp. NPDC059627]
LSDRSSTMCTVTRCFISLNLWAPLTGRRVRRGARRTGAAAGPRAGTARNTGALWRHGWLKDPYDCAGIGEDAELDSSGG